MLPKGFTERVQRAYGGLALVSGSERAEREVLERARHGSRCPDPDADVPLCDPIVVAYVLDLAAVDAQREDDRIAADAARVDLVLFAAERIARLRPAGE